MSNLRGNEPRSTEPTCGLENAQRQHCGGLKKAIRRLDRLKFLPSIPIPLVP
jgi:hypothetical protein